VVVAVTFIHLGTNEPHKFPLCLTCAIQIHNLHYAVPNFGGVHELDASALSLICSVVSSQWLRDAKYTLGCLMWAYFYTASFIRLLLPEQAHCPIQTSVNTSSVMCGRHTVDLVGNYSLFFLCSKLSLSFFLCILLPLFYVLRFTSSPFLLPIHRFFNLLFRYSLLFFSLSYSFLPFLFFPVRVPPFAFSVFLLISFFRILSLSFFFLLLFLSRFLYFSAVVFETCKYSSTPLIRINWDGEPSG